MAFGARPAPAGVVRSDGTVTNGRDFAKLELVKTDEGLEYGSDGGSGPARGAR